MEITGKVIKVLPEQRFNGKNGEVVKNFFILETKEQYPQKIKFDVFGEDKWKAMGVTVEQDVSVQFDIKGAEWQGKYFVNLQAWKVTAIGGGAQQQKNQPSPKQNQESPQNEDDSNLPF